jgi:hypothetical protein
MGEPDKRSMNDAPDTAGEVEERTIVVFFHDTLRDLVTAYKTKGCWIDGSFDPRPWSEGELRCDSVRGSLMYQAGDHPAGRSRFVVERILLWETGELVYSEVDAA